MVLKKKLSLCLQMVQYSGGVCDQLVPHLHGRHLALGIELQVPRREVLVSLQVDVESREVNAPLVQIQEDLLRGERAAVVIDHDGVVLGPLQERLIFFTKTVVVTRKT
jgi:hypothetical protein